MTGKPARRGVISLALISVAGLLAAGCSTPSPENTSEPTPSAGGSLAGENVVVQSPGDWTTLDIVQTVTGFRGREIAFTVYDRLVELGPDPETGELTLLPYVATSWEAEPDQIVFEVRDDVTCEDGTVMTPSLMADGFNLFFEKKPSANTIWGAGKKTATGDDDAGTLTIDFEQPNSLGIYGFAHGEQGIICPAAINDLTILTNGSAGTGPYSIVEAIHGDHITFQKRDEWVWGPNGITSEDLPDTVTFQIIGDPATAATALLNGQVDMAVISRNDAPRVEANPEILRQTAISTLSDSIWFNQAAGRLTEELEMRQAIAAAIDRPTLAAAAGRVPGVASYLNETAFCYDPEADESLPEAPDPDKARELFEELGYTSGSDGKLTKDGQPLTLNYIANQGNILNGADYVVKQLTDAGVTVVAEVLPFQPFLERLRAGQWDILTAENRDDNPSPGTPLASWTGNPPAQGGGNFSSANNPDALDLIAEARAASGEESCEFWAELQRSFNEQLTILPYGADQITWGTSGINIFPSVTIPNVRFWTKAD